MTQDYCTSSPDWWGDIYVGYCCKIHDIAYGLGLDRYLADLDFHACLLALGLPPIIATFYYTAVRLFGWLFWKKSK